MTEFAPRHLYRGKVRDLYEVGPDHLLMVASDRLSAFDVVMNETIVHKGRVLTALTDYWLSSAGSRVPTALVSCDPTVIEDYAPGFVGQTNWHGRSMLVRRAQMLPLECIVRGRLAGQAYDEYRVSGTVHGMAAPTGMELTDPFPTPMFTPSTKADEGHDLNIDLATAATLVGDEVLAQAQSLCQGLFTWASERLAAAGLTLADTKFELGFVDGELVVCDEVITPDSSRMWPSDEIVRGQVPPAFDKQPFRDWLSAQPWDRTPPPPPLPDEILDITSRRYVAAYERVTGKSLSDWYGRDDEILRPR
ncbi:MAG: phosphoribosylaminoimidazolesuccinocarboxamide synthase [Actinomycetota bacterium]